MQNQTLLPSVEVSPVIIENPKNIDQYKVFQIEYYVDDSHYKHKLPIVNEYTTVRVLMDWKIMLSTLIKYGKEHLLRYNVSKLRNCLTQAIEAYFQNNKREMQEFVKEFQEIFLQSLQQ